MTYTSIPVQLLVPRYVRDSTPSAVPQIIGRQSISLCSDVPRPRLMVRVLPDTRWHLFILTLVHACRLHPVFKIVSLKAAPPVGVF